MGEQFVTTTKHFRKLLAADVYKRQGQEYHATLTMPEGALQAGNNYTYTVKVRNKVLEVSLSLIHI